MDAWRAALRDINPRTAYKLAENNWMIIAGTGDCARGRDFVDQNHPCDFFHEIMVKQTGARRFSREGIYEDGSFLDNLDLRANPVPYDGYTHYFLDSLIEHGYTGPWRAFVDDFCERGVKMSALMQVRSLLRPCIRVCSHSLSVAGWRRPCATRGTQYWILVLRGCRCGFV